MSDDPAMTTPPDLSVIKAAAGAATAEAVARALWISDGGIARIFDERPFSHPAGSEYADQLKACFRRANTILALMSPSTTEALIARIEAAEARTVEADRECERQANLADERAERMGELHARAQAAEARVEKLEGALREAEIVLALVEPLRWEDRDYGDEVRQLGDRIGYGALMSSAQASWRIRATEAGHPGSEFVAGPCFSTVIRTLALIREALTPTGGQNEN